MLAAFAGSCLDSTTAKVLNDTDCPVLTTEHAETIVPSGATRTEDPRAHSVLKLGNSLQRLLFFIGWSLGFRLDFADQGQV
jgi:hypothetical protein